RSMLINAGLPQTLWPNAVEYAVYLINRVPTSAIPNGKTPHQALKEALGSERILPELGHLERFGKKGYIHIPSAVRQKGRKFDPRGKVGYLIGMEGTTIYKMWVPETRKIE
ncbi:hypothetical protein K432DRAFT_450509, partial [Lepidopterella palustris CBS 459.81]